eukprot:6204534-Pleurochrysis_carterae.AAC.1
MAAPSAAADLSTRSTVTGYVPLPPRTTPLHLSSRPACALKCLAHGRPHDTVLFLPPPPPPLQSLNAFPFCMLKRQSGAMLNRHSGAVVCAISLAAGMCLRLSVRDASVFASAELSARTLRSPSRRRHTTAEPVKGMRPTCRSVQS